VSVLFQRSRTLGVSCWEQGGARNERTLFPVSWTPLIMYEASPSAYPSGMLMLGKNKVTKEGGDRMRFYTHQHPFSCGIDLHARSMYVCILSHDGEIVLHRHMKAAPEAFLKAIAPYRDGLVVAVECIFTWYWLADLCAQEDIPFVLGHALYMNAIHGGKAKNDQIDSQKIAALLRGGMLPQADVYPAQMRATRDLLRRRTHLMRKRAELLAHVQNTNSQYNLPEIGKKIAYRASREGVAERFEEAAVQKTIEVDLDLITDYNELLKDLELYLLKTVKQHDANTLYLLQTIPVIGKILAQFIADCIGPKPPSIVSGETPIQFVIELVIQGEPQLCRWCRLSTPSSMPNPVKPTSRRCAGKSGPARVAAVSASTSVPGGRITTSPD